MSHDYPHIGTVCGKCGEHYDINSRRFDFGPGDFPDYDDYSEMRELHMYCPQCDHWTAWAFVIGEDDSGDGWPEPPDLVYTVADEFWQAMGHDQHKTVLYEFKTD